MIDSKTAARLRHKKRAGKKLSKDNARKLDEYERSKQPQPEQQPEAQPEGSPTSEQPQPEQQPEAQPETPPIEGVEAPPDFKISQQPLATAATAAKAGAWQDKYKAAANVGGAMDGREMLCTFIAGQWLEAMKALEADLALVGKDPIVPAERLYPVAVIALDQILPDRARLSPPIAVVVGSTTTAVQRWRNHKAIVEVQKSNGTLEAYKRKQATEAADARAAQEAEAKARELAATKAKAEAPKEPERAEPPQQEQAPMLDQTPSSRQTTATEPRPNNGLRDDDVI